MNEMPELAGGHFFILKREHRTSQDSVHSTGSQPASILIVAQAKHVYTLCILVILSSCAKQILQIQKGWSMLQKHREKPASKSELLP